jgi:hypothetical protein
MAKSKLKIYRTYRFIDKDPIIDKMRTVVEGSNATYLRIHELSGISTTTLTNWFHGDTRRPQFATLNAVARALDHELALRKIK